MRREERYRYVVDHFRREMPEADTELCYGSTEHGFVDAKTFRPCNAKKRMPVLFEKMNSNIKSFD